MLHIIFLIGLPGSGKTYYANNYLRNNHNYFIDDFSVNDIEWCLEDFKKSGKNQLIISDPNLCLVSQESAKESIKKMLNEIKEFEFLFLYFENNPEQCIKNIAHRNDDRCIFEKSIRELWSKNYIIPENAVVFPVYKAS